MFAAIDSAIVGVASRGDRPTLAGCPTTSCPSSIARSVAALMHALRPGTSPPAGRIRDLHAEAPPAHTKNVSGHPVQLLRHGTHLRASARGTSTTSEPCSATIRPQPPDDGEVDGRVTEPGREDPVGGDRAPAALDVTEHRHPRLPTRQALQVRRDDLRDPAEPREAALVERVLGRSPSCPSTGPRPRPRPRSRRSDRAGAGAGAASPPRRGRTGARGSGSCRRRRRCPASRAIQPALRPITSMTIRRLWLSAVVCSRSIASVATWTAVANPMHESVPDRSLSIVFGMPMTGIPSSASRRGAPERPFAPDRDQPVDAEVAQRRANPVDAALAEGVRPRCCRGWCPPRCRIPWTDSSVSSRTSPSMTPRHPSRNPRTSCPSTPTARRTIARMAAFNPGQSPPPVRMPIRSRSPPDRDVRTDSRKPVRRSTSIVRPDNRPPAHARTEEPGGPEDLG